LRKGLQLNVDYRGVAKDVWQIFHRMYGGGPPVVREDLDIYSQDLSSELTLKRLGSKRAGSSRKTGAAVTNIFAAGASKSEKIPSEKSQPIKSIQPKKRNLFMSENLGADEDIGEAGLFKEEALNEQRS
jgi:hypothetical protein